MRQKNIEIKNNDALIQDSNRIGNGKSALLQYNGRESEFSSRN